MNATTPPPSVNEEFRQHWRLVVATSVAFAFTSIMTSASGLFMQPLADEFGWSRALLSSGNLISAMLIFFLSPLFGWFIDRIGTRRLALPGLALMALAIAGLGGLTGAVWMWFAIWTVYAVASLATKSTVWTAAVASTFTTGRGLAMGLTLSGSALAQTFTPPLTEWLIATYGWRWAFAGLGLGWGGVALVLCVLFLRDGYEGSRREREGESQPAGPLLDQPGLSPKEALRSRELWFIAISTFLMMVITIALVVHQFPILTASGMTRAQAAGFAGLAGAAGILGKLVTGWLLDRYAARWVGGITLGLTAITFVLLLVPGHGPAMVAAAFIVNGYAAGTKLQIAGYLTSVYGGMRHFGLIYGTMASFIALGSGAGPWIAGRVFDLNGTYDPFLWFGLVGTLVSSGLLFLLGPYPAWHQSRLGSAGPVEPRTTSSA